MKMQIVDTKHLGGLNSLSFFCKCGRTRAGECQICTPPKKEEKSADEGDRGPSILERLFPDRWFSTQVIVFAIVAIVVFVFVFNAWSRTTAGN